MCNLFANQNPERYASATRRLRLNGQSTSVRLENAFWDILDQIAVEEGLTTPAMVSKLHSENPRNSRRARQFHLDAALRLPHLP